MRKIADLLTAPMDAGRGLYENLDKLLCLSVPATIGAVTWAGLKSLDPQAVAENADRFVLNEALKSSLAASIRKHEQQQREKKAQAEAASIYSHDRFL